MPLLFIHRLQMYRLLLAFICLLIGSTGVFAAAPNEDSTIIAPTILSVNAQLVDSVSCNGLADGAAHAEGAGGSGPYSYLWSNGNTTDSIINVASGVYFITLTDSIGNVAVDSIWVPEPDSLLLLLNTLTNVSCTGGSDGSVEVGFSGGNDTVGYAWSTASINYIVVSLVAGDYSVTITDLKGCQDSMTYTVTQPSTAPFISGSSVANSYCYGGEVGEVSVVGNGGTAPYTYAWNSGNTGPIASNLGAGTYVVTLTDSLGCQHDSSFTITEPVAPGSALITGNNAACFGDSTGSLTASFVGGIAPFSYVWSNNVYTATNAGIPFGAYSVTVSDSVGCAQVASDTILEPSELIATAFILDSLLCYGDSTGSVYAQATGGIAPYTLLWQGYANDTVFNLVAGSYTAILTDSSGCVDSAVINLPQPDLLMVDSAYAMATQCHGSNTGAIQQWTSGGTSPYGYLWSTGETTAHIDSLSAGSYGLTLTDANGCLQDTVLTVLQPDSLEVGVSVWIAALCSNSEDGALLVSGTGGTNPYSYLWNTGATQDSLQGIGTGTYTVTLTDTNGCVESASVLLPYLYEAPVSGLASTALFCDQDSAILSAIPGEASYAWTNGSTMAQTFVLQSGVYTVTILSAEGCQTIDSTEVTMAASTPMSLGNDTIVCTEGGAASLVLALAPNLFESYIWSTGDTLQSITVTTSGTFSLTATNAAQCPSVDTVLVEFDDCQNTGLGGGFAYGSLKLYPNPTSTHAALEWPMNPGQIIHYTLTSTHGELIQEVWSSTRSVRFDLTAASAGVYFIRAEVNGAMQHFRLIRQ
ncbi:MAG: hypothetical protein HQ500_12315 [Flavobacteriales bacterium]|nr:hypothetical protein [Flavobacteriales bacterium]